MAIVVRRFTASEWPEYRDLRLRALAESPDAFGSMFDREAKRSDDEWRNRLALAVRSDRELPLVAVVDGDGVGLAWARIDEQQADLARLFQVWVAPEARGLGVGRALLEAAISWARGAGARALRLGVTRMDSAAVRLYRRAGFVDVGEPEPLRPGSALQCQPMCLALDSTAS
jgi:GNAT superfamily N-acetyltransferase